MLGRAVGERLAQAPPEEVWAPEVRELCRSCDLVVCNLECCISSRGEPTARVRGKPFFFRGPPQAVRSLQAIGVRRGRPRQQPRARLRGRGADRDARAASRGRHRRRRVRSRRVRGAARRHRRGRGPAAGAGGRLRPSARVRGRSRTLPGSRTATWAAGLPAWLSDELGRLERECDLVVAFPHWGPNMTTEPGELAAPGGRAATGGGRRPGRGPLGARVPRRRVGTAGSAAVRSGRRARRLRESTGGCETTWA